MNRTFKPNRRGITLLFVISILVLFLLLGTAFVIVANNFNRASTDRIRNNVVEGKGSEQFSQLLETTMYKIIRGGDLEDIDSPLRTENLLADQYGFGLKTIVSGTPSLDGAFVEFSLTSPNGVDGQGLNLLDGTLNALTPGGFGLNNSKGGRVLSFTTGPAKGFSTRIYSDEVTGSTHNFRIPSFSVSGDVITQAMVDDPDFIGSEVIINGRDFSGTGADVKVDANLEPIRLGPQALLPNRVGQTLSDLMTSYMLRTDLSGMTPPTSQSNSVNEPWDAPDISNMWLSGLDQNGDVIPSFYRTKLVNSGQVSTLTAGRTFFHAFDMGDDDMPDVDTDGDGKNDAFWMETGESVVTNRNGRRFKPLFAIHIKDLDAMPNVNAHGNLTQLENDGYVEDSQLWPGGEQISRSSSGPSGARGFGLGTAEINLISVVGQNNYRNLLSSRYGDDGLPGDGTSFRTRGKLFGYPKGFVDPNTAQYGTIGGLYRGSPMDIHGRFDFGYPSTASNLRINNNPNSFTQGLENFADPNFPTTFSTSMPQIGVLTSRQFDSTLPDEFSGNPYEMWLGGPTGPDNPFTAEELERVLRPADVDSQLLADRLSSILDGNGIRSVTTHSFDVPTLNQDFVETLLRKITQKDGTLSRSDAATTINTLADTQFAFAPELFRGLKMDINRQFSSGQADAGVNADATVLLDGETDLDFTYGTGENPRAIFARQLYMLVMLLVEPVDFDGNNTVSNEEKFQFAKSIAQWTVNVVDFRDPDSICTRFNYDPSPFDTTGWNPTDFVWGAERPELLITETLAVHIQNRERVDPDDENNLAYQQRLRPEPFAYFEVYNPWTQNSLNQQLPPELYSGDGVDLAKVVGGSPVWRFEVERAELDGDGNIEQYTPLRYVYMANPGTVVKYNDSNENQVSENIEIFFPKTATNVTARPGRQVLIGTRGFGDDETTQVFMGRRTDAMEAADGSVESLKLDETTRLELDAANGTVTRYTGDNADSIGNDFDGNKLPATRQTSIVYIDQATPATNSGGRADRKFSLSDAFGGYPATTRDITNGDGSIYDPPKMDSVDTADKNRTQDEINNMIQIQDGISKNFRFVRLQRLANPTIAWNINTNPYLTVDSMEVDLVSINGAAAPDMSKNEATNSQAVSHERGGKRPIGNQTTRPVRPVLWGFQRQLEIRVPTPGVANSTTHHYALPFSESLGMTNDVWIPTRYTNSTKPFPWLTWNNRPFVSHMEIMNVPYLPSDRLTYAPESNLDSLDPSFRVQPFTIDTFESDLDINFGSNDGVFNRTRPGGLAGRFGHLLNFFAGEVDSAGTNQFSDIYKLLDFIEVPSRFVSNESYYLSANQGGDAFTHPFNTIPRYRAPGKVNINTMLGNDTWVATTNNGSSAAVPVLYDRVRDSVFGRNPPAAVTLANPFRPAEWANLIPGVDNSATAGSACGLVRSQFPGGQSPLLDSNFSKISQDGRNAGFRNSFRTRLGNLVTNKSSVFACWITVGFFEVDANNNLVDTSGIAFHTDKSMKPSLSNGTRVPAEVGVEFGEQVRHRAFFIFDRSIPVAFEPGKNHNIEKGILVKSIIE